MKAQLKRETDLCGYLADVGIFEIAQSPATASTRTILVVSEGEWLMEML